MWNKGMETWAGKGIGFEGLAIIHNSFKIIFWFIYLDLYGWIEHSTVYQALC